MDNTEPDIHIFHELQQIYQASRSAAAGILRLAGLEMQLAKKSLISMVCLCILLLFVAACSWFWLNVLGIVCLMSWNLTLALALLIIIFVNLLLAIVFYILLLKNRRDIAFTATRKQISQHMGSSLNT
jgi:uncharacterized membrane protein YqjE